MSLDVMFTEEPEQLTEERCTHPNCGLPMVRKGDALRCSSNLISHPVRVVLPHVTRGDVWNALAVDDPDPAFDSPWAKYSARAQ